MWLKYKNEMDFEKKGKKLQKLEKERRKLEESSFLVDWTIFKETNIEILFKPVLFIAVDG